MKCKVAKVTAIVHKYIVNYGAFGIERKCKLVNGRGYVVCAEASKEANVCVCVCVCACV